MIASQAGVEHPMIHYYFGSKEKLFYEMAEAIYDETIPVQESWYDGLDTMSFKDGFSLFIDRMLDYTMDKPDALRIAAVNDIKTILSQNGGKMVSEGAVRWMFERKGIIIINLTEQTPEMQNQETLEMEAIEAGADDIYWFENILEIHTSPEATEATKKALESKNIKVKSFSLGWIPKEEIDADEKTRTQNENLIEKLNDNDSVQEVYSNLKD